MTRRHKFFGSCACCTTVPLEATAVSRRAVLSGAAAGLALGATTFLPGGTARAQGAKSKVVDTHHHFYPPAYQKAWFDYEEQRKIPHFPTQTAWTRDKA